MKTRLTDEQVEKEIERLKQSKFVKIAQKEQREKMKRRQYMYTLRGLEKRGKQISKFGITMETLSEIDAQCAEIKEG